MNITVLDGYTLNLISLIGSDYMLSMPVPDNGATTMISAFGVLLKPNLQKKPSE